MPIEERMKYADMYGGCDPSFKERINSELKEGYKEPYKLYGHLFIGDKHIKSKSCDTFDNEEIVLSSDSLWFVPRYDNEYSSTYMGQVLTSIVELGDLPLSEQDLIFLSDVKPELIFHDNCGHLFADDKHLKLSCMKCLSEFNDSINREAIKSRGFFINLKGDTIRHL